MSKKSATLIPKIIQAGNTEQAITVLNQVLKSLHFSSDYLELVSLKDELDDYQLKFNEVCEKCVQENDITILNNIRIELNFLFREITDKLVFPINKLKVQMEENKTITRAHRMMEIRENETVQGKIKATSTTALRDIVGLSDEYKENVACISISYGLYKQLEMLLNGIRMMTDSLASKVNTERTILMKDVK